MGESVLSRVVRILESFGPDNQTLRVSEIARRAGLHIATTSRLVDELVRHGWLQRDEDRAVLIGVRLWELASRASPTLPLRDAAMPFMQDLHAVVGQHIQLAVRSEHEVLVLERLAAPGAVINLSRIAGRLPMHVSSSGLVLLAHAPAEVREQVLAAPLVRLTPHTVCDPGKLRALLAAVRRDDHALCRGFVDPAATGIAVPLRDRSGSVIAALSAVVPNDENARSQLPALRAAALGITRALGTP